MPVPPVAPGTFSTGIPWPRFGSSSLLTSRASWSAPPPGPHGTMSSIGRDGYFSCAALGPARPAIKAAVASSRQQRRPTVRWRHVMFIVASSLQLEGAVQQWLPRQLARVGLCGRNVSLRPALALDLRAMHDPARLRIEGIAPVHGRAVVPQQEVTDSPLVPVRELGPID